MGSSMVLYPGGLSYTEGHGFRKQAFPVRVFNEAVHPSAGFLPMSDRFLIVGLGNPGPQYEATRHNVGFMALEAFSRHAGIAGKKEARFNAIVGTGRHGRHSLILVQPLTFMNASGDAVAALLRYYEVEPARMLVVYDDVALPFGRIRLRPGGSDAGQKGMRSIIARLDGSGDFPRLRIGIGSPPAKMAMQNYVLSRFDEEERQNLPEIIATATEAMDVWLDEGIEAAMTRYNGRYLLPSPEPAPSEGQGLGRE